jgi:hypothetical protein
VILYAQKLRTAYGDVRGTGGLENLGVSSTALYRNYIKAIISCGDFTQPPIQWVAVVLSAGLKRPGREADPSLPSRAEVKNSWSYIPLPPTSSWRGT